MARRKKRQSAPPRSGWNRTLETLEQRLVMSAAPLMTHHGMGAGFDEIPSLGHHAIVDEPAMTHHAIIDEPGLSHHDLGPSLGTGVIESSPAVDPEADFWLDRDLLGEADLGEKISQTLREAHGLTGQDEVLSKYGFDGAGQTVVVIDSGIAHSHTALGGGYGPGHRIVGGWDFTENDADFYDDGPEGSHGTHVAGIIGAEGTTHSGVATGVDLVGLRVFDDAGNGYFSWVEDALQWTVANIGTFEHDITAVNLSLGTYWNSDSNPSWAMLEDEFAALEAAGVFVSVSAGNDFTDFNAKGVSYPASSDHVIPVMSVDNNGNLSYFSQRAEYAIAAPGRAITSTVPDYAANDGDTIDDDWQSKSGTSMAAPYVAGSSVLVREAMEFVGMTDIDQWDIYDHMMATADTFYDSATDTNYQRLNLEAAIDALMPEDDFGSSVETAHNLGTLNDSSQANPLGSLSGVISTLDDADYFTFTAGSTGTVTFSASESHALDGTWDAWGGAWSTTHNGDCVIDVVAGQTYTVSLSTADGLGYYDLNFDLESSFAAIDWGAVAAQETRSGLNVSGEAWYSVTAGRTGYLTAETLPAAGSATVEVYDAQQNLVGSAGSRVDVDAIVGEQFMLRVVGDSSDFDLRLTNAVTLSGSTIVVAGTDGDDAVSLQAGASEHVVSLNGVAYAVEASGYDGFHFDGGAGVDTLRVSSVDTLALSVAGDEAIENLDAMAFVIDQDLGLYTAGSSHLNWGGWGERWFQSASGAWHFITPTGELYRFASSGSMADSTLIATLDASFHSDINRLTAATNGAFATAGYAASLDAEHLLSYGGNYYEDWGGWGEKWIKSGEGGWFFITGGGELYKWDGNADLSHSQLVATLGADYHSDPSRLYDAGVSVNETSALSLDQQLDLSSPGSYYENWGGWQEKWVLGSSNQWYFITPTGGVYQWNGSSNLNGSRLVAALDATFYDDPSKLHDAAATPTSSGLASNSNQAAATQTYESWGAAVVAQSSTVRSNIEGGRTESITTERVTVSRDQAFAALDQGDELTERDSNEELLGRGENSDEDDEAAAALALADVNSWGEWGV